MLRSAASKVMWVGRATAFMVGLAVMLALVLGVATTALAAIPGDPFRLGQTNGIDAMSALVGNVAGTMLRVDNSSTRAGATALDLRVEAGKAPMKVNSGAKVANLNADKVDGKDASAFYAAGSKVADSSHADVADTATSAADANTLDGKDSSEFANSSHTHSGADITSGTVEADRIEDGQGSNLNADQLDGLNSTDLRLKTGVYEVLKAHNGMANMTTFSAVSCDAGDEVLAGGYIGLSSGARVVTSIPQLNGTWGIGLESGSTAGSVNMYVQCYDFPPAHVGGS